MKLLTVLFVLAFCAHLCLSAPFIKVSCDGVPLYRGRVDNIVSPGAVSGHVHKIAGGNNFGVSYASQTPLQIYQHLLNSSCTTCSVATVDNSAYWHPDLYYKWANGSLSLVPSGGLLVYYLGRTGDGAQANPSYRAFPPGFRMISGNPFRRSFNASRVADKAISFACLSEGGGPETNDLSLTKTRFCKNGLRLQVHFPQCWDGVRLDTPNHMDHVAFPLTRPDGGNCPASHPVRLFNLFFEAFYSVSQFPHGAAPNGDGEQRFVLACGDSTGYGFHGDFLNGWKEDVLQAVLNDPSCDSGNTNDGNNVRNCKPLTDYVQSPPGPDKCSLSKKIPLTENLGLNTVIDALPGCNPITGYGPNGVICSAAPSATANPPATKRFHLKSELTQKFWSCPPTTVNLLSFANGTGLTYYEVFVTNPYTGSLVSIRNDGPTRRFLGAGGQNNGIVCDKSGVSNWEGFEFKPQANGKVAILANRNSKYVTARADGSFGADSSTIGTAQLFTQVVPNGGTVF